MSPSGSSTNEDLRLTQLAQRMGPALLQQRLAMEDRREARTVPPETPALHPRRWLNRNGLIRAGLTLGGLRARGRRNVLDIQLRHNTLRVRKLPPAFEGHTLLHLSDPHLDMDEEFLQHLIARVQGLRFDTCVLTGDFRFRSHGPWQGALDALARLRPLLGEQVFSVLGNHDTVHMVPGMEAMGIQVLMNESARLTRAGQALRLAGVDDPHHYRTHDIRKAASGITSSECAILLAHSPEPYRLAAQAGFSLMLCGHTHGGQVCLPGGLPVLASLRTPRAYVRGNWHYAGMAGYTSVGCGASIVDVRLNCLPELTLHRLQGA